MPYRWRVALRCRFAILPAVRQSEGKAIMAIHMQTDARPGEVQVGTPSRYRSLHLTGQPAAAINAVSLQDAPWAVLGYVGESGGGSRRTPRRKTSYRGSRACRPQQC